MVQDKAGDSFMKNRWKMLFFVGATGAISVAILGLIGYLPGMGLL